MLITIFEKTDDSGKPYTIYAWSKRSARYFDSRKMSTASLQRMETVLSNAAHVTEAGYYISPLPPRKTEQEIAELKANWQEDPCWDIEDTPGFGAHYAELRTWRQRYELARQGDFYGRMYRKSKELGIEGNIILAAYIERLEARLEALEAKIARMPAPVKES